MVCYNGYNDPEETFTCSDVFRWSPMMQGPINELALVYTKAADDISLYALPPMARIRDLIGFDSRCRKTVAAYVRSHDSRESAALCRVEKLAISPRSSRGVRAFDSLPCKTR